MSSPAGAPTTVPGGSVSPGVAQPCPSDGSGGPPDSDATPAPTKADPQTRPKQYFAAIYPGKDQVIPAEFASQIMRLESLIGAQVWLLVQNGNDAYSDIDYKLFKAFQAARNEISSGRPVALLVDSPGGSVHHAYEIARLFQRRTPKFIVIIPQYAKSAATLFPLAASEVIIGKDAELGPLDVQMFERDREAYGSALDAVQSLEQLHAFSMMGMDQLMQLLLTRTSRKSESLLPHTLSYAANFVRPLLENMDTVEFTKKARELKVAEQYAIRLMKPNYTEAKAKEIAARLVEQYPTHGFVIDCQEATGSDGLGLRAAKFSNETGEVLDSLVSFLDEFTALGFLREVAP